jgi:formate hydrogenlyase subunit 3/multisubunit Na+/H+ antiporter MnhD subunit
MGNWAVALMLAGFVAKLAFVPMLLWLPAVAEAVPALVMGLVIAVVDMAAFGELYLAASLQPGMLQPSALWIGVALATSLVASVLMLAQRDVKRLLAFSTIEDMGFLLLGLQAANLIGLQGALIGAAAHAVAKTLLFVSISAPEAEGNLNRRGLAQRYPVSAAGFLVGMLAMLGVPPTIGFAGRWRLYLTAADTNHWLLVGFVLASMLALLSYVMFFARTWWGPVDEDGLATLSGAKSEPWALRTVIAVLIAVLIAAGLWPNVLLALAGGM